MSEFEQTLNDILVDTLNFILKYEEASLRSISSTPVTVSEAHILESIARQGDHATVSGIAFSQAVAPPTITVAVKKMQKKGFVSKLPCSEDGRRQIISLTELGSKINRAHGIFHRRMVRNIGGEFSEEEKNVLLSALKKLSIFFKDRVEKKK